MNIYQEIRAGFQANVFFQADKCSSMDSLTMKILYVGIVKAMWEGVIVIPFSVMLPEHKIRNSRSLLLTKLTHMKNHSCKWVILRYQQCNIYGFNYSK